MSTLVLLRHGESEWNRANLFTGWVDVNLSETGVKEAWRGGELLLDKGVLPDVCHTSLLTRAIRTATLALEACGRTWVPVKRSWRLNERHYGGLQGMNKKQTLAEYGEELFMKWRRSYSDPPPALKPGQQSGFDERYRYLAPDILPQTECLKDVVIRMLPYWYDGIVPDLLEGRVTLVAAHGNSLRALVKHLDGMTDEAVVALNIPTGIPLVYQLDDTLNVVEKGYLDPTAAEAAAKKVADQGK
jgi:2,3-bisphosphoglycerate-dependent phosphoglycerate mutase